MYTASIQLILSDTISTISNQTSSATVSSSARSLYPLSQKLVFTSGSIGIGVDNADAIASTFHVAGGAYVRDYFKSASIGIGIDAASALHVNGGAIISGNAHVGESASIYGTFYVEDSASFIGVISNTGNASVGGNLSVYGIPDGPPSQFFQPIIGHSASFDTASFTSTITTTASIKSASISSTKIQTASITTASIATMILYNSSSALGNFHMDGNARTMGTASFYGNIKIFDNSSIDFYDAAGDPITNTKIGEIYSPADGESVKFLLQSNKNFLIEGIDSASVRISTKLKVDNNTVVATNASVGGDLQVYGNLTVTGTLTNATTNRISANTVQSTFEGAAVSDIRFAASMVEINMNVIGTTSSGYSVITLPSNVSGGLASKTFLTFSQHQSSTPGAGRLLFNHKLDDDGTCQTASVYVRDVLGTLTNDVTVVYHIIQYRTA